MKSLHPDKIKGSASPDYKLLVNIALVIKMLKVLEEKKMRYLGSHFILLSKCISLLLGNTVFRYRVTALECKLFK